MRARITWLVAATTSAIVVAFVLPLCLLVRDLAFDRAVEAGRQEAQSVATVVAGVDDKASLQQTVALFVSQGMRVTVITEDDRAFGVAPEGTHDNAAVARARSARTAFTRRTPDGIDILIPVTTARGTAVVLQTVPDAELSNGVPQAWTTIILLGLALICGSLIVARQLGARVSEPVTEVARVAHRLREGELDARAAVVGPPEAAELGRALNQLADRIDSLLDEERESIADLAHRLRTPITALRLDAEQVADPALSERMHEHVDHLHRSIDAVVRDARRKAGSALLRRCDAAAAVRERGLFWQPLAEDQGRDLAIVVPDTPVAVGLSDDDLVEALDTLLDNVFTHTPEGAPARVSVTHDDHRAVVTVEDGGPGAGTHVATRGTSRANSTGLGLDIVRHVAHSCEGEMVMRRSELGGLAVDLVLPVVPA